MRSHIHTGIVKLQIVVLAHHIDARVDIAIKGLFLVAQVKHTISSAHLHRCRLLARDDTIGDKLCCEVIVY